MSRTLIPAALAAALFVIPASGEAQMARKDIVTVALEAGSFTTLATALEAAGLVETLQGEGPFTVFAPSDEAFAKLPAGTVEALLQDKEKLTRILTSHVGGGEGASGEVVNLTEATTLAGIEASIEVKDGEVWVGGAKVTTVDIQASNGIIHVIDRVMLPSEH